MFKLGEKAKATKRAWHLIRLVWDFATAFPHEHWVKYTLERPAKKQK